MNKKFLPLAVAGILAGAMGAAQAGGVVLYGKVQVSIDAFDEQGDSDDINLNSVPNYSALGVKGSEDLGNGLTAMFQLEYGAEPANAGTLGRRDQWAGLKGGFGTVRFGAISTNYKQSGAAIDPFWRTSLDTRLNGRLSDLHSGTGSNGQGRATSTVRYDSPSFSGAKVVANYTFDQSKATIEDDDVWGVGVHYSQGPIFASLDYITNDVGGDDDAWKLGGKYTLGDAAFYGSYERGGLLFADLGSLSLDRAAFEALPDYDANSVASDTNGSKKANVWHLAASYTLGSTMAYVSYGRGDEKAGFDDDKYRSWMLAVNHNFTKRTSVYGGFARQDWDHDGGRYDLTTFGMVHNF